MSRTTSISGPEARHRTANLLHRYTEVADRKDVAAAVALLGGATVGFPSGGYDRPEDAEAFFTQLWQDCPPHRHDVSNLIVEPASGGAWRASAHYSRWMFQPEPVLHTLGTYDLGFDATAWTISHLTVTRTWTQA